MIEWLADLSGEPFADRLQLATAERVNQPAIEGDALAVALLDALQQLSERQLVEMLHLDFAR